MNVKEIIILYQTIYKDFELYYIILIMTCTLSLTNQGYKDYPLLSSDGITHPNWGIDTNKLLSATLTSSTTFKYYSLGTGLGATWGNRYSFCINRQTSNISNFYVIISSTQPLATSVTLNGIMSSTNFYYNSSNNNYYVNNSSIGIPALYVYPNVNVDGGQIYFRIESDGKIYSGYSKQTSSLIGTSNFTGSIYVGIVVQQTSGTGTGTYKMIPHTLFDPAPTINPNPFAGHSIYTNFSTTTFGYKDGTSFNNGTGVAIYNGPLNGTQLIHTLGSSYTNNGTTYRKFWGIDFYFSIQLTLNGNNIKIGVGSGYSSNYHLNYYYDTFDGKCYIGNVVGATLAPGLTNLTFRFDKFTNFYVGDSPTNLTLVGNVYQTIETRQRIYTTTYYEQYGFNASGIISYGNVNSSIQIKHIEYGSNLAGYDGKLRCNDVNQSIGTIFKLVNNSLSSAPLISTVDRTFWAGGTYGGNGESSYYGTSLSLQTIGIQTIANLYISVAFNCNNSGGLSPFTVQNYVTTGTRSFYYNVSTNVFRLNNTIISSSFVPTSSLLTLNGKLYCEVNPDGKIYFGNDEANKILITNGPSGMVANVDSLTMMLWVEPAGSGKYAYKLLYPS